MTLEQNEVHIWVSKLGTPAANSTQYQPALTPQEITEASNLSSPSRKQTFILSRGKLRTLLQHYTGLAASHIILTKNKHNKPFIAEHQNQTKPVFFNISHSKNYILHAFAQCKNMGIDIEFMRDNRSFDSLAERCFTDIEKQQYQQSPEKLNTFYRLWTLKEAFLKAQGTGLAGGLKSVEFLLNKNSLIADIALLGNNQTMIPHAETFFIDSDYQSSCVCDLTNPKLLLFYD